MGSPLGPALANIFVDYDEEKIFSQTLNTPTYFRYIDDTFAIFDHEAEADEILTKFNCLNPLFNILKKRKENVRFLMFTSKEEMLSLKPVHTGFPLSPASIYVGSPLVFLNEK